MTSLVPKSFDALLEPAKEFLNEVSGPLRTELGQALGAVVMPYRVQLQAWALFKAKEKLEAKGLKPGPVRSKVLLPILENCSVEDEPDMHDRWHNLLANAASGSLGDDILPVFAEILKQLTSVEACLIERAVASPRIRVGPLLRGHFKERFPHSDDDRYRIAIDTLLQQRLLEETVEYESGTFASIVSEPALIAGKRFATQEQIEELANEIESATEGARIEVSLRVTALGGRFVRACSEPQIGRQRIGVKASS